jgi:hypothetical protein
MQVEGKPIALGTEVSYKTDPRHNTHAFEMRAQSSSIGGGRRPACALSSEFPSSGGAALAAGLLSCRAAPEPAASFGLSGTLWLGTVAAAALQSEPPLLARTCPPCSSKAFSSHH